MFIYDPENRISLLDVSIHPWVTDTDLPTEEEINIEV